MKKAHLMLVALLACLGSMASEPGKTERQVLEEVSRVEKGGEFAYMYGDYADPSEAVTAFAKQIEKVSDVRTRSKILGLIDSMESRNLWLKYKEYGHWTGNKELERALVKCVLEDQNAVIRETAAIGILRLCDIEQLDKELAELGPLLLESPQRSSKTMVEIYGLLPSTSLNSLRKLAQPYLSPEKVSEELEAMGYKGRDNSFLMKGLLARHGDKEIEEELLKKLDTVSDKGVLESDLLWEGLIVANTPAVKKALAGLLGSERTIGTDSGDATVRMLRDDCAGAIVAMMCYEEEFPIKHYDSSSASLNKLREWCTANWAIHYPKH